MAQFYSACTSFPTEPDRFTQKALLYLFRTGKDAPAIQKRQRYETVAENYVLKVNQGKDAHSVFCK